MNPIDAFVAEVRRLESEHVRIHTENASLRERVRELQEHNHQMALAAVQASHGESGHGVWIKVSITDEALRFGRAPLSIVKHHIGELYRSVEDHLRKKGIVTG